MTNIVDGKRPRRGDATRQKISVAAVELVAELGWDAVTTRAVATRAGVNPALVHYHFGSMDALLRGAVMSAMDEEIGPAARTFADEASLGAGVAGAVDAVGRVDPRSPAFGLLIEAMARAMRDPTLAEVMVDGIREFRALVAERVRTAAIAGETRAGLPPEATGVLVAAALDGLLFHRIIDPATDIDGFRDVLLRLIDTPLANDPMPEITPNPDRADPARGGTP